MFSSFFAQPQVMQELASQHTPLTFRRGFTRDCGSLVRRAYAARSIDRIQTAFDVQASSVYTALDDEEAEVEEDWNQFMELVDVDPSLGGGIDDAMANYDFLFGTEQSPLQEAAELHELRATEQLLREQPPLQSVRQVFQRFDNTIDRYNDVQCQQYFWLSKVQLRRLFVAWQVPPTFKTKGGYRWTGESAFLMFLRRICNIIVYHDPHIRQEMGGKSVPSMSNIFHTFQEWLNDKIVTDELMGGNLDKWHDEIPRWVDMIHSKVGDYPVQNFGHVCMFLDGTFVPTTRPSGWSLIQRVLWTRYKASHGVGFLAVLAPNGLIVDWWGPGKQQQQRHDMCSPFVLTPSLMLLLLLLLLLLFFQDLVATKTTGWSRKAIYAFGFVVCLIFVARWLCLFVHTGI